MFFRGLCFRSNGFCYVYQSGFGLGNSVWMGMTEESYNTAKSSYNVLSFISLRCSKEENMDLLMDEFNLDRSNRNISASNKQKDMCVSCLNNFYSDVYPNKIEPLLKGNKFTLVLDLSDINVNGPTDVVLIQNASEQDILDELSNSSSLDKFQKCPCRVESTLFTTVMRMRSSNREIDLKTYSNRLCSGFSPAIILLSVYSREETSVINLTTFERLCLICDTLNREKISDTLQDELFALSPEGEGGEARILSIEDSDSVYIL